MAADVISIDSRRGGTGKVSPAGPLPAYLSPRPLRTAWGRFTTTEMWWGLQRAFWVVVILAGLCAAFWLLGALHDLAPISSWAVEH